MPDRLPAIGRAQNARSRRARRQDSRGAMSRPVLPRVLRHRRSLPALLEGSGALLPYLQGPRGPPRRDSRLGEERSGGAGDQRVDRALSGEIPPGWYVIIGAPVMRPAAEDDK